MGSPRHDSRYSAIDMSLSLRASNDRAKALNRESLYIDPAPHLVAAPFERVVCVTFSSNARCTGPSNQSPHWPPLDTRPTPRGNAILVLDDPSWIKKHLNPTPCNRIATFRITTGMLSRGGLTHY